MDKLTIFGGEELIEVEGILFCFSLNLYPLFQFIFDDFGHLVGVKIQFW